MANAKHIFIGIGGSGCQTVSQIKEKVYDKRFPSATASKSRLEAMNDIYRFLFIDTDSRDVEEANKRNREKFEYGRVPFISSQTDLVALGRANPKAIYYEATQEPETLINKRILEACSPELAAKIPDQPLAFGAGAFRMKSRIAFAHSLTDFQSKLQAAISALNDVKTVGGEDCTIFYWVVGSTNGGTGSGIVNDVLYHVNQIHRQVVGNGDPQLVLTMYMPKVYIDANSTEEKYALNAFAVFSEIGGFKEMSQVRNQNTVMHRMAFVNDYNLIDSRRSYCPFYYLIPIDIQTDKGTSLGTTRTMYRNTAEMLYHLHAGQGGDTFRSDIDNYMNDIMERNHEDFLVPMGYVSLHKPMEQFDNYFRTRFKRDLLRTLLINEESEENEIDDAKAKVLASDLFLQLDKDKDTLAKRLGSSFRDIMQNDLDRNKIEGQQKLDDELQLEVITGKVNEAKGRFEQERKQEKRDKTKKMLTNGIWRKSEEMMRQKGIVYAINVVDKVHEYLSADYKAFQDNLSKREQALRDSYDGDEGLSTLEANALEVKMTEKIMGSNKVDVEKYFNALETWVSDTYNMVADTWKYDLLKDFCDDPKNDELSKLKRRLLQIKEKMTEMNTDAVKNYSKLATTFGNTALDVTTVYLPQLKNICDGNGWKPGNFFSNMYRTIIDAKEDTAETPDRDDLVRFVNDAIYQSKNEDVQLELKKGQYIFFEELDDLKNKGKKITTEDVLCFANQNVIDVKPEKLVDDFIILATKALERAMRDKQDIQEKWTNKRISDFFYELSNDEKDEVRKSLNPALFFNYNTSRIEVTKKEEHIVFVACTEELAHEMLGFEKGNPKHRFEAGDDSNSALVLKSKFGLSFKDYRIYDSLQMVYDKASFREKYHFHHDYAQFLSRITINDLPDEVLPQHRTFAKILLFKEFESDLKPFFYEDEYDKDNYVSSLYLKDPDIPNCFEIARPEAFSMRGDKLCLRKDDKGRILFDEITGGDFAQQFEKFFNLFYNHRYEETLNNVLLAIMRNKIQIADANGMTKSEDGEHIVKRLFAEKQHSLLKKLNNEKASSTTDAERRLYTVLFDIVRERYNEAHKFLGKV